MESALIPAVWAPESQSKFRFTPEQIKKEMADAGYAVDTEHDFLPRQIFLMFK